MKSYYQVDMKTTGIPWHHTHCIYNAVYNVHFICNMHRLWILLYLIDLEENQTFSRKLKIILKSIIEVLVSLSCPKFSKVIRSNIPLPRKKPYFAWNLWKCFWHSFNHDYLICAEIALEVVIFFRAWLENFALDVQIFLRSSGPIKLVLKRSNLTVFQAELLIWF